MYSCSLDIIRDLLCGLHALLPALLLFLGNWTLVITIVLHGLFFGPGNFIFEFIVNSVADFSWLFVLYWITVPVKTCIVKDHSRKLLDRVLGSSLEDFQ